jgi:NAD-dependent deacetylase
MADEADIAAAGDLLRRAGHVTVLTGAGASAESGVPTFRDALTGLWARFDPATLATPEAFDRDPALVARWYDERRVMAIGCQPHAGHRALVELQRIVPRFTLVTQNVDRLHQRAGSSGVIELHGSLAVWRCTGCGEEREETGEPFPEHPPRCRRCGHARRPGVVWFGERLPEAAMAAAKAEAADCDVFLSVGTSSVVHPAAGLVERASRAGAKVIEVNPMATPLSAAADLRLRGTAGAVLPAVVGIIGGSLGPSAGAGEA